MCVACNRQSPIFKQFKNIPRKACKDIKALNSYHQSGHAVLIGKIKHNWQDTDSVLELFGDTAWKARNSYLTFVTKGLITVAVQSLSAVVCSDHTVAGLH